MSRDEAVRQVLGGLVFAVGAAGFALEGSPGLAVAWSVVAVAWFGVAARSAVRLRRDPDGEVRDDRLRRLTAVEVPAVAGALTAGVVLALVADHPSAYLAGGMAVAVLCLVVARLVRWRLVSRRTG